MGQENQKKIKNGDLPWNPHNQQARYINRMIYKIIASVANTTFSTWHVHQQFYIAFEQCFFDFFRLFGMARKNGENFLK